MIRKGRRNGVVFLSAARTGVDAIFCPRRTAGKPLPEVRLSTGKIASRMISAGPERDYLVSPPPRWAGHLRLTGAGNWRAGTHQGTPQYCHRAGQPPPVRLIAEIERTGPDSDVRQVGQHALH